MRISDWSSDVCSSDLLKGKVRFRDVGGSEDLHSTERYDLRQETACRLGPKCSTFRHSYSILRAESTTVRHAVLPMPHAPLQLSPGLRWLAVHLTLVFVTAFLNERT